MPTDSQDPRPPSPDPSAGSQAQRSPTQTNRLSRPYLQFTIAPQRSIRPNGKRGYKITSISDFMDNKSPTKIPAPLVIRKTSNPSPQPEIPAPLVIRKTSNLTLQPEIPAPLVIRKTSKPTPQPETPLTPPSPPTPGRMSQYRATSLRETHTPNVFDTEEEMLSGYGKKRLHNRPDPSRSSHGPSVEGDESGNATDLPQHTDPLSAAYDWAARPALSIIQDRVKAELRSAAAMKQTDKETLIASSQAEAGRAAAATKGGRKKNNHDSKGSAPMPSDKLTAGPKANKVSLYAASGQQDPASKGEATTVSHRTLISPKPSAMDERCPIMGTQPVRGITRGERPSNLGSQLALQGASAMRADGTIESSEDSDSDHGETNRGDTGFGHYAFRNRMSYNVPASPPRPASKPAASGTGFRNGHASLPLLPINSGTGDANLAHAVPTGGTARDCFHPAPLYPEGAELTPDQRARQYEYLQRERIRHDTFVNNPTIFSDVKKVEEQRKAMMARQKGMVKCSVCGRWREPGTKCCDVRVRCE